MDSASSDGGALSIFDALSHEGQLAVLQEVAERATDSYDLPGGLTVSMINLSENATYRIDAPDGRRWALRVHRDGYHTRAAIASELAWLTDLRQTGVVITPVPVKARDGQLIQSVDHPSLARPRHVVLSDWETGIEPGINEELAGPFQVLGEVTARMHIHARQWQRPSWFTRHSWDFETS